MNKAQLILDLETKVIKLAGGAVLRSQVEGINTYTQGVITAEGVDKATDRTIAFIVIDEGTETEHAYYRDTVSLPKAENEAGMMYMAGLVMSGLIDGFEVESMRPDLGPFSFFIVKVWADNGAGKLVERRFRVSYNAQGVPAHKEIV